MVALEWSVLVSWPVIHDRITVVNTNPRNPIAQMMDGMIIKTGGSHDFDPWSNLNVGKMFISYTWDGRLWIPRSEGRGVWSTELKERCRLELLDGACLSTILCSVFSLPMQGGREGFLCKLGLTKKSSLGRVEAVEGSFISEFATAISLEVLEQEALIDGFNFNTFVLFSMLW